MPSQPLDAMFHDLTSRALALRGRQIISKSAVPGISAEDRAALDGEAAKVSGLLTEGLRGTLAVRQMRLNDLMPILENFWLCDKAVRSQFHGDKDAFFALCRLGATTLTATA